MNDDQKPGVTALDLQVDGRPVQKIVLNNGNIAVSLLTLGAILQDLRLPGVPYSLTLGTSQVSAYTDALVYCGSLIGPVVNRISNSQAQLGGTTRHFESNLPGKTTLHSGTTGTQTRNWTIGEINTASVVLELNLPDGTGGFPGNRVIAARFALIGPHTLEMRVAATTDADTWINFANHSFWNLDGTPTFAGHRLQVAADRFCVSDDNALVTGEVRSVDGTPFDFRTGRELTGENDVKLDLNFCLAEARRPVQKVLTLTGKSGISLSLETSEPGVQIYDASSYTSAGIPGHDGRPFDTYAGLAIEAQGWPDAPNHRNFPSVVLRGGQSYEQITRWTFSN